MFLIRSHLFYFSFSLILFSLAQPGLTVAQVDVTTANFVEWDLPSFEGAGTCPSAIGAITLAPPTGQPIDPVYYVTRCDAPSLNDPTRVGPAVIQFQPGTPVEGATATWTAWNLGNIPLSSPTGVGDFGPTGGIRLSTRGQAFVRGSTQLLRVDLVRNMLTRWTDVVVNDDPDSISDVAIVERTNGNIDVYTTHDVTMDAMHPAGIVQRLTVPNGCAPDSSACDTAQITRWPVDGGAGLHYLSGIAYFQGKIYFSEGNLATLPDATNPLITRGNGVGVLDPNTGHVWHFSLSAVGASGPRQLSIDTGGVIWAVTASGHVVSVKPNLNSGKADIASYLIPGAGVPASPGATADPRGVSTSGSVVGFTESGGKKVGLLIPNKPPTQVTASQEDVTPSSTPLPGTSESVTPDTGTVEPCAPFQPCPKTSPAVHTDIDPLGEFIEATLPDTGDFPLGILRDPFAPDPGTFYVAVQVNGTTEHRLSRVSFPVSLATTQLVTGGGTIDPTTLSTIPVLDVDPDAWPLDGGKANFGFNVYRKSPLAPVRGRLNYVRKDTGEHVKGDVTDGPVIDPVNHTATFSGTCSNTNSLGLTTVCTFTVKVKDGGNPGRGNDTFEIDGVGVQPTGGTLTGGNIKIHSKK
jgi:hypothetical protein